MKYLYPILRGSKDYQFGKTDEAETETETENLCSANCKHESPIEASDCFREQLLKNKPSVINIESRKCVFPKCANQTEQALNYGYDFEFAVCKEHQNKTSVKKVAGFGFPLILHEKIK